MAYLQFYKAQFIYSTISTYFSAFCYPLFPIIRRVFQISGIFRQRCPALSFIEILFLLDLLGHFQCPSRPANLALYPMLPFPIKNRRNRYPVWSPLSHVRRLNSSPAHRTGGDALARLGHLHSAFNFALNHCSSEYGRLTWPL